jgi:hypothetical protein
MRYRFGVFRLDLGPPLELSSGDSPVEMQQRPLEVPRHILENRPRPVIFSLKTGVTEDREPKWKSRSILLEALLDRCWFDPASRRQDGHTPISYRSQCMG